MGRVIVSTPTFPILLERYFTQRLMQQRRASAHTIASYRDTFRLLLQFIQKRLGKAPSALTLEDIDAPLAAPDQRTWSGRRDHALILVAVQTGLRLSELTGLQRENLHLGVGAHVRVIGKGRKERCTPLSRNTRA